MDAHRAQTRDIEHECGAVLGVSAERAASMHCDRADVWPSRCQIVDYVTAEILEHPASAMHFRLPVVR
jgi:hypothetical protein